MTARDADLVAGIQLVKEGDFENAVLKLDAAVRGLEAVGERVEAAQGYLYLGVAYLELDQEALARGKFAQALARQPQMSLDPGEFSPQVIRTFEATRNEALPPESGRRPPASGASPNEAAELRKKRSSVAPYLILGGVAATAGGIALASDGGPRASPTPGPSPSPLPSPPTPTPTPPPCVFRAFPRAQQEIPATGATSRCFISAPAGCAWEAVTTEPLWLLITSGKRGTGEEGVHFKVLPNNSGSARKGEIELLQDSNVGCLIRQEAAPLAVRAPASWTSELAVPGGSGRLALDGSFVSLQGQSGSLGGRVLTPGTHRFEAVLTAGQGPGVWRFRLREGFRAGTLRVLAGEAASVGTDAIVFRLRGRAGERIVFTAEAGR
jgi:hypothetical protein